MVCLLKALFVFEISPQSPFKHHPLSLYEFKQSSTPT